METGRERFPAQDRGLSAVSLRSVSTSNTFRPSTALAIGVMRVIVIGSVSQGSAESAIGRDRQQHVAALHRGAQRLRQVAGNDYAVEGCGDADAVQLLLDSR